MQLYRPSAIEKIFFPIFKKAMNINKRESITENKTN